MSTGAELTKISVRGPNLEAEPTLGIKQSESLQASNPDSLNKPYKMFNEMTHFSTNFSVKQFLEFLLYHIVFFLLLGPLMSVILILMGKSNLVRNLAFWGISKDFLMQTLVFFINIIAVFGWMYWGTETIHKSEVILLLASSLLRAMIVATKYAFFSVKQLRSVRTKVLKDSERGSEMMLVWAQQLDSAVARELSDVYIRNNIDQTLFKFFFLKPLKDEVLESLLQEGKIENDSKLDLDQKKCGGSYQYDGNLIARFLIKKSIERGSFFTKNPWLVCLFISFCRAFIPIIFRYIETGSFSTPILSENLVIMAFFLGSVYFFMINLLFLYRGIVEYERLVKLLGQLSNLLSIAPVERYQVKKRFPTLNVFCNLTLGSWYSLNLIFRDYGRRFFNRIDVHLSFFLLCYTALAVLIALQIYQVIELRDNLFIIFGGFDCCIMLILTLALIWKGVVINDHFSVHRDLLIVHRDIVNRFMLFSDFYFEKQDFEPENEIYKIGKDLLNFKIREAAAGSNINFALKREEYLMKLLKINKMVQNQLTYDEDKRPFKVLGVKANKALFQQIVTGLGTLATTIANKLSIF